MTKISSIYHLEDLYELYVKYSSILLTTTFVLSMIICVVGFIGNAIVIFSAVFIMKKHQSKIWFLNLAIADFVFLLCLPFHAVAYLNGNWPFGSGVCKVYNFLYAANMHASIFILAALSIDRALAVANPIWHHKFFSQRARYCICAAIWSVTVLA
uniref:G-protein coupled receptors family 1 profile domain-containing protein n=1 Tax=Leptobrachium leishanense TaxID=445787 RepID=A0A8C5PI21_9ANUR